MRRSTPLRAPLLTLLACAIGAPALMGLVILWPSGEPGPDVPALSSFDGVYTATTVERNEQACAGADASTRCLSLTFRLLEGPDEGATATIEQPADHPRLARVDFGR